MHCKRGMRPLFLTKARYSTPAVSCLASKRGRPIMVSCDVLPVHSTLRDALLFNRRTRGAQSDNPHLTIRYSATIHYGIASLL